MRAHSGGSLGAAMAFKIAAAVAFVVVMVAFSRLIAKPAAEAYGLWALLAAAAILFPIGFWMESRAKRRRHEVAQEGLRAEAARMPSSIIDDRGKPQRRDVIE